MDPAISDTYMFLTTAKEIWDSIRQTYSKARDAAQVYEIKELDHYRVFEMKCSEDTIILKNFIEKDRVYDFLVRLNPKFDQVRVQILGKEETPSLEKTISLIKVEESRRGIMLEPQTLEGGQQKSQANLTEQTKQSERQEKGGKSPFPFRFHVSEKCLANCWVIDSGAIDMSHTSQYFCTYTPCPSSRKIMVANGSLATVARLEDVYVTPSLILKNVLHDQCSGRKIGLAKERNGLYYL
ncbi:hypothetical protein CK203_117495 [Vitis vinifera]|uniref:Uncharacterized protein n=1 Tax=Vitis vinifera TaxID=29760 RepID=A0A438FCU3_VITVI|nr:hypothetical protein CK203_117495 [Vitis vinifera]